MVCVLGFVSVVCACGLCLHLGGVCLCVLRVVWFGQVWSGLAWFDAMRCGVVCEKNGGYSLLGLDQICYCM
jgi:hypothetical protein